jgi:hypothetical protein
MLAENLANLVGKAPVALACGFSPFSGLSRSGEHTCFLAPRMVLLKLWRIGREFKVRLIQPIAISL